MAIESIGTRLMPCHFIAGLDSVWLTETGHIVQSSLATQSHLAQLHLDQGHELEGFSLHLRR